MVPRPVTPDEDVALIPQFFAGRSVFITGATGFMGKVLIERLLWTCPDIGRLYLLMREKRDVPVEKRLAQLKSSQVFDVIRTHCPHQLDKLYAVPGDTMKPQLGIQNMHLQMLHEVSIVFHSAATLKFDEALDVAIEQNVLSVIRLMEICDELPRMQALIHVSTAYSNAELPVVSERVYTPPTAVQDAIAVSKTLPPEVLKELTPRYISPKPNTYTFTKALAESAILEHMTRTYPVAIFRPSIVISAKQHPYPGWIENLNGPSGILVGAGKGLLHVFCCRAGAKADLLPVDIAIDTLIAVAWETATMRPKEVPVYNCSTGENPTTWADFERMLRTCLVSHPFDDTYWYPSGFCVENRILEKILQTATQTLPLHLGEYLCRLLGVNHKINLITVSSRLAAMSEVLRFFSTREWTFENGNVRRLRDKLSKADREIYNLDVRTVDWSEHYVHFVQGARKYLLKEKDQDIERARTHVRRMYYVHITFLCLCAGLFARLVVRCGGLQLLLSLVGALYRALDRVRGS